MIKWNVLPVEMRCVTFFHSFKVKLKKRIFLEIIICKYLPFIALRCQMMFYCFEMLNDIFMIFM